MTDPRAADSALPEAAEGSDDASTRAMLSGPAPVPALVCALEGLALLGFCGFYFYQLVLGEGDDATRVVMSIALMALVGVGLLVMARAWLKGLAWPRTPTILWNLLLLPVAWSMFGAGFWGAWPLAVVALLGIVSAWRAVPATPGDRLL